MEGVACFVPRTAPGDVAQVALQMRSRFATGRLLQVLQAAPARVEPRCPHYIVDRCGGCQLQHMESEAQRAARATIVRDALQRIARRDVPVPAVEPGPSDWEYRRRLTLALQKSGSRWIGGLHPYDDASRVFELEVCPITQPLLVHAWHAVRRCSEALPSVAALRLGLRLLDDGQVAIVVIGGRDWPRAGEFASHVLAQEPALRTVWWEPEAGAAQCIADRAAPRSLEEGEHRDDALSFVQVNAPVAAMLRAWVAERTLAATPSHVVDAYAGSGLLTEQLARAGVHVTSIELDAHATRRAKARVAGIDYARVLTGSVETLLPEVLAEQAPDVVIVNPPRRGLEPAIPAALNVTAHTGTRCIIYISCDPATLARDLSGLTHWRIESLRCFDMFPQTSHVETVCVLEPEKA